MKMTAEEIKALIERRLNACKNNLEIGYNNRDWFLAQKAAYEELLNSIR